MNTKIFKPMPLLWFIMTFTKWYIIIVHILLWSIINVHQSALHTLAREKIYEVQLSGRKVRNSIDVHFRPTLQAGVHVRAFWNQLDRYQPIQPAQGHSCRRLKCNVERSWVVGRQVPRPTLYTLQDWGRPNVMMSGFLYFERWAYCIRLSLSCHVGQPQGCIYRLTCSHSELTKDHVLTSAHVKIFRTVTLNAVNKNVCKKKDCSWHAMNIFICTSTNVLRT